MPVNLDIWGPETQWVHTYTSDDVSIGLKSSMENYGSHHWSSDSLNVDPVANAPLDNTLAFCGQVCDTRDFYRAKAIVFDENDETFPLYQDEPIYNLIWSLVPQWGYDIFGFGGVLPRWDANYNNRWSEWSPPTDVWHGDGYYSPMCTLLFKHKLNKMLMIPYVNASATGEFDDSSQQILLGSWVDSAHTTYPYLHNVFFQIASSTNPGVDDWSGYLSSSGWTFDISCNTEFSNDVQSKTDNNKFKISYGMYAYGSNRQNIYVMGFHQPDGEYINSSNHPIGLDPDITHYVYNDDHSRIRYVREYSNELVEEIYHQLAFFGMFFVGKGSTTFNTTSTLYDDNIFCGTIDENGYAHGEYTQGIYNLLQPQLNWEDTDDSNYDPSVIPTPPNNWSNDFPTKYSVYAKYLANHWYLFDDADLYKFFAEVNNVDLSTLDKNATYGLNPIDGVLQVKRIFANFTTAKTHLMTTASQYTKIGSLQLDIGSQVANIATFNETYTKDCGTKFAYEIYPDFRSYAPFSSICFYDAFCGVIELQPEKVLNKYITVEQTIDLLLGDKITSVYASPDGSVNKRVRIATLHGNCAEDIPVNGQAVADYQRNKYILTQQKTQQEFTTAGRFAMGVGGATISAVEGNFVGAIAQVIGAGENLGAGITGIKTTEQLIEHTIPSIVRVSQGSSNVEDGVIFPPMLIIFPPKMLESYNESEYADKAGFSGYKIDTLANCGVGTHIVSHPRIEISGTSSEMYTIVDQLQKGIYVKPILE